jgi:ferredoxin
MEIRVDRNLCEANAVCCGLAPEVFELDDDENLVVRQPRYDTLPAARQERVRTALDRCPKHALSVS